MSLPVIFEPARVDGMLLVDGGVLDNAPVEIAKSLDADKVILVDIHRDIKEVSTAGIKNTYQLLYRMVETMVANTTEEKMKRADLVIRVNLEIDALDYSDPLKIIEAGEKIARENIDEIKNLVT